MKFKQFYLGCLAHASYYVGFGDEASTATVAILRAVSRTSAIAPTSSAS